MCFARQIKILRKIISIPLEPVPGDFTKLFIKVGIQEVLFFQIPQNLKSLNAQTARL